jgi:hypothetical protein
MAVVETRVQLAVKHRSRVVVENLLRSTANAPYFDPTRSAATAVACKQMAALSARMIITLFHMTGTRILRKIALHFSMPPFLSFGCPDLPVSFAVCLICEMKIKLTSVPLRVIIITQSEHFFI